MKFVCENCKAKYQIGDDKVAGKTVRMKCRRCGHMIQVNAAITENSVSRRLPTPPPGAAADATSGLARGVRAPGVPSPPRPGLDDEATSIMAMPPPAAPRPAPAAPRSSTAAAAASVAGLAAPAAGARPIGRASSPQLAPSGPLAGMATAFSHAVAAPPPPAPSLQETAADDWYVGVAGVPLGPVRLSVIREKAAVGAVDGDSLVWREGYDEWQPLRNFPQLLEIVEEAAAKAHGRRSATFTPAPMPAPAPDPSAPFNLVRPTPAPPAPQPPKPSPPKPAPPKPSPLGGDRVSSPPAPPRPSHVHEPLAAGGLGSVGGGIGTPVPTPTGGVPAASGGIPGLIDPLAPPVAATGAVPSGAAASGSLGVFGDVAGTPLPAEPNKTNGAQAAGAGVVGLPTAEPAPRKVESSPDSVVGPPPKRGGRHPMAYAFIAMCAAFGAVAAYVFLVKPERVVVVEKGPATRETVAPGANAPPPPPDATDVGADPPSASGDPVAPGVGGPAVAMGGPMPGTEAPKGTETGVSTGTGSQSSFNTGVEGPAAGPNGAGAGEGSGGQLSAGEIQGVVSRNQARIRRKCWEPAYAARSKSAPSSAKVNVTITIGPTGDVQSASASGGNGYPGLASCVQSQVSSWKFPASGGTSTANIPFGFVAQ
jgi:predicted Zn finger-like uncharacterized protein